MEKKFLLDDWQFRECGKENRNIRLPHDAMQHQGRDPKSPGGRDQAFYLGGEYVYTKNIYAQKEWKDKYVFIEFEGIYPNATIFLNNKEIYKSVNGYNGFIVPLTDLQYESNNELKVFVDNSNVHNSRWYSGAGIYRAVHLLIAPREHIKPSGVKISTVSIHPARIAIDVDHTGEENTEVAISVKYKGTEISLIKEDNLYKIDNAFLWDDKTPHLYECSVELIKDNKVIDTHTEAFGVRMLAWSSQEGFTVNGTEVLLKGGCIHHDNGILGARSYPKAEYRRVKKLKQAGFNAIRSSHNPISKDALKACDELGMYVIDELWDMWYSAKTEYDYSRYFEENFKSDIYNIVEKNYNHPSVIMYSIGNEVTEPAEEKGIKIANEMVELLHHLDRSRAVTCGINLTLLYLSTLENNPLDGGALPTNGKMTSTDYNEIVSNAGNKMTEVSTMSEAGEIAAPILDLLDIAGYNYAVKRYHMEGELNPNRIVVGLETYTYDLPKTWKEVEKYPYLIGDFMWTSWDYLGEAGIGGWSFEEEDLGFVKKFPWKLADTGAFDILGNRRVEANMAAVVWGAQEKPSIGVRPPTHPGVEAIQAVWRATNAIPNWSFNNCDGAETMIEVYSKAYEVECFINEESIGRKQLEDYKAVFETIYYKGECRVVAYNENGTIHSENKLVSADEQIKINIQPEENTLDLDDIVYVNISLTDENGVVECNQDTTLSILVKGGELLAFGSANPKTSESFVSGEYTTYYGQSQAVIRTTEESLIIKVNGDGLQEAVLKM